MDAIERDLHSYSGIISTAQTRAAGIRKLLSDSSTAKLLADRGVDEADAKHLEDAASVLAADFEKLRQHWAEIQAISKHLHEESAALADDIRSVEDAARSALGRNSELLPTLGIKPARRTVTRHASSTTTPTTPALNAKAT